uniref:Uncharacterized protein n=1 Tax=Acrobeloides nanus TaxID=290746 RepID=A0A914D7U1_9BILA
MIKFLIFFSSLICFLPSVFGSICPLADDFVCNNQTKHECLCVPPVTTLNPIRLVNRVLNDQKYCNEIVDTEDENFNAISITFNLEEESDKNVHDKNDSDENDEEEEVNEEDLREKIAKSMKIDEERVVLIQIECIDDNANLTVKFVVLKPEEELAKLRESDDDDSDEDDDQQEVNLKKSQKKGKDDDDEVNVPRSKYGKQQVEVDTHKTNKNGKKQDDDDDDDDKVGKDGDDDDEEDEEEDGDDEFDPYEPAHLEDAKKMIRNATKIRRGSTLADLKVWKIEDVHEVSSFEPPVSNTIILIGVIALLIGVALVALLGCYISFKKCRKHSGYSDTLQRP